MYLFVYGALKRGYRLNGHLTCNGGIFVCEATTKPKYLMYDNGAYPCLRDVSSLKTHGAYIEGEIWHINKDILSLLDSVENVPYQYRRELISLKDIDYLVWGYVINEDYRDFNHRMWKPAGTKWIQKRISKETANKFFSSME